MSVYEVVERQEQPTKSFEEFRVGDVVVAIHTRIPGIKINATTIAFGFDAAQSGGGLCSDVQPHTHYIVPKRLNIKVEI